jgi:hypothetical protein
MEMPVEDLIRAYLALNSAPALEAVEAEPVAAYPTQRVRFETGENEDSAVHDVVLIRTDAWYFVFEARIGVDIYGGYSDGYAEGDVADWGRMVESLDCLTRRPAGRASRA